MTLDSIFMIPFGFLQVAEDWEPSRVALVGDAAHAMLPTLGMGANLALRDAQQLVERLDAAGRDRAGIVAAIGDYERDMREVAYPLHRMTLDHDKNFGGGALNRPEADESGEALAGSSADHDAG
jgi:2-polyprenyl-6-methoxyphenol hydroxylase-like FAD-dependent oxidoreductase